jgi:hypothetical protein
MYTKEEAKKIREEYWNQFRSWSARLRTRNGKKGRWMLNDTGIKQLKLKFHFDEERALAGIDVDTRNLDKRIEIWDKLESLKPRLEEIADFELIWDMEFAVDKEKSVSRIYTDLVPVNIYEKKDWKKVNTFFYERMTIIEDFFLEYKDYLKYKITGNSI